MAQDNIGFSADFSENMSVESILAEYNAKKASDISPEKPEWEVSYPIEFKSEENDAIGVAGLNITEDSSESLDILLDKAPPKGTQLSEVLSRIKNEEDKKVENGPLINKAPVSTDKKSTLNDASLIDSLLSVKSDNFSEIGSPDDSHVKEAAFDKYSQNYEKGSEADFTDKFHIVAQSLPSSEDSSPTSDHVFDFLLDQTPESLDFSGTYGSEDGSEYAPVSNYEQNEENRQYIQEKPDLKERLLYPIIAIITYSASRREKRRLEAQKRRDAQPKAEVPELEPSKAAVLYAQQSDSLKLRSYFASGLTAVLLYLSYGLPTPGLLGSNHAVRALVCLIFELSIMVVGLDIFTNGVLSLIRKKPGAESLISLSAVVTAIGALYIALSGNFELGLPFCAVSALSMTFALWGEKLSCDNFAISFYTASQAKDPTIIISKPGIDDEGCALAKIQRPVTGFVRTAEDSDIFEDIYKLFTPIIIVASIVLSLFCTLASKSNPNLIHTLGASLSISASLTAIFGFSLPFSVSAKRLSRSGVAIAGYSGSAEIGSNRRVIIADTDIFPPRAVSIGDISIAEGIAPQKVISYTGSMISAAGLGVAPVFTQLMRKNGSVMQKVEDFACHEGGGILARINGDIVYVGTVSFMHLMGIKIPRNTASRTTVYTSINDSLAGYFSMDYTAVASVQRALVSLLSGISEPVFAIRDFNITPMLLKQKFRLPTGNYDFPSFADRYRISESEFKDNGTVSAMFSRGGLNAVAGLCRRGRRLYISFRLISALSIIGSLVGMSLILALCWNAAYNSASCGNIITYMLLWLLPAIVISYGLRR